MEQQRGRTKLRSLSNEELSALRLLNDKLREAETWVAKRAAQCVADYQNAGGLTRTQLDPQTFEDFCIEAKVRCLLSEAHPNFDPNEDNFVATLDATHVIRGDVEMATFNFDEVRDARPHPLDDMHFCFLFHDLYDHTFRGDWDKTLSVGGLWVDVELVQQRIVTWDLENLAFRGKPDIFR
jgi:hypothetical protein